jgi:hypothetical protein
MTPHPSHFAEIAAAFVLGVALCGTAWAALYAPHTDCGKKAGQSRISCNKQLGNIQRSGVQTRERPSTPRTAPAQTSARSGRTMH